MLSGTSRSLHFGSDSAASLSPGTSLLSLRSFTPGANRPPPAPRSARAPPRGVQAQPLSLPDSQVRPPDVPGARPLPCKLLLGPGTVPTLYRPSTPATPHMRPCRPRPQFSSSTFPTLNSAHPPTSLPSWAPLARPHNG